MKKIMIILFVLLLCSSIAMGFVSDEYKKADMNNNEKIDLNDAILIIQHISKKTLPSVAIQLQNLLDNSFAKSAGTGGILLVQSPSFQWVGATGMANVENSIPMKTADMLRIASMSKTFTSVVVLKLIEEGVLGLNDYISDHLSDSILDKIENADDITIKHLLSMTSGIYDYSNDEAYFRAAMNRPAREAWLPEEIIAYIDGKTASFYPGEGWEYCNTNYILLEMIVALKTGKSLAQEMRRIIFNPLHMTQTFLEIKETREGGFGGLLVRGYDLENAPEIKDITEENDALGMGDGGLISDAYGLAKFLKGMFCDKVILSQSTFNLMTNFGGYVNLNELEGEEKEDASTYSLGLGKTITEHGVVWGHDGKSAGFEGEMRYYIDSETIIVLLTNAENDLNGPDNIFDSVMPLISNDPAK